MHALPKRNLQTISLAATIPPELLTKIVHFVGHEALLSNLDDNEPNPNALYFVDRKGGMRHLSACSLTCVYWAKISRQRMFRILVLRSIQDINDLLSFFNTPNSHVYARRGIPPILHCLQHLIVEHRLGDWVWFHNIRRLLKSQVAHQSYTALRLDVHVFGGDLPGQDSMGAYFPAARHPLFRCMPRPLPIPQVSYKSMRLSAKNLRFADVSGLKNLVRDFNLRSADWHGMEKDEKWTVDRPWRWSTDRIYCHNVHWNVEPPGTTGIAPGFPLVLTQNEDVSSADMTTVIIGADEAEMDGPSVVASGCTDNVAVAFDCLMAALGSHNRRIPPMKIENWEVVMGLVHGFRDGAPGVDVRLEGSWCYRTASLLFELELEFVFTTQTPPPPLPSPPPPTTSIFSKQLELPILAVESIRFNTTSQDLLGREQVHEVREVYIQLRSQTEPLSSESPVHTLYDWPEITTIITRFTSLTSITISCQSRDVLMGFARKMKETLRVVEDMLVLAYFDTVKNEGGIVKSEELKTDG